MSHTPHHTKSPLGSLGRDTPPDPLAAIKGAYSKGRGREGRGGEGRGEEGKGGEGEGGTCSKVLGGIDAPGESYSKKMNTDEGVKRSFINLEQNPNPLLLSFAKVEITSMLVVK